MTQGQDAPDLSFPRCPRCGGRMYKPSNSTLYWHADGHHPRCNITNIAEAGLIVQRAEVPESDPPSESKARRRKK